MAPFVLSLSKCSWQMLLLSFFHILNKTLRVSKPSRFIVLSIDGVLFDDFISLLVVHKTPKTMSFIKEEYYSDWNDFVQYLGKLPKNSNFIWRGHTNSIINRKFYRWKLISSFNRFYDNGYSFSWFLGQQLAFFNYYEKYQYKEINQLSKLDTLGKCYFLQHYGVPTSFIDFTHDPLIAFYFALTSFKAVVGGSKDINGEWAIYSNEETRDYITIYQLNTILLRQKLEVKEIGKCFDDTLLKYKSDYPLHSSAKVALDLNPASRIDDENFNLEKQKSCFLLFDLEYPTGSACFEDYLRQNVKQKNISLEEPILILHNINYNSLMENNNLKRESAARFLKNKKVFGEFLFDDIQGLKYDFNFFHDL